MKNAPAVDSDVAKPTSREREALSNSVARRKMTESIKLLIAKTSTVVAYVQTRLEKP